jgi:hypothetical protein
MYKTIKKKWYDSGIVPLPVALSGGIPQVGEHIHKYIGHLDFFALTDHIRLHFSHQ